MFDEVSVVVPSFEGVKVLRRALTTLLAAAPEAEVIVVDGGSRDGSPEMARAEFPRVRVLDVANHGWAHASNRGFAAATRRLLVTMNSDLLANRDALLAMARSLEDPRVGAAGPVLRNEDGSRQPAFGPLYWPNWLPADRARAVPVLHGGCLMTRQDVLERVGGFDENFFFYNEEFDWCWRLRRGGYRRVLVPQAVVHLGGGSTPGNPSFQVEGFRGGLYLLAKHAPEAVTAVARACVQGVAGVGERVARHEEARAAWRQIASIARRNALLESPFPLSGRGEWRPGGL